MQKITGYQFQKMIEENPSVFEHWDTPLEITESVDCSYSPITHLSKYLIFSGKDNRPTEWNIRFSHCPNLEIATGTFYSSVDFSESNIQKIENLKVDATCGISASFTNCKNLQIATGNFKTSVIFGQSGIEKIENLSIHKPNDDGHYAYFKECRNLKTLEGWDLSKKISIEPKKLEAEIKRRAALKQFVKNTNPQELPFL
jgi:hypothetical protein